MQYILVREPDAEGSASAAPDPLFSEDNAWSDDATAPRTVATPRAYRRHPRTRTDALLVKVRIGDKMNVAKVHDISLGGLLAACHKDVPMGAYVELALLRPGHDEVALSGIVVANTTWRAGLAVRFENLTEAMLVFLRHAVVPEENPRRDVVDNVDPATLGEATRLVDQEQKREFDALRRRVARLQAENERLRTEVDEGESAQRLAGRLQVEIERLKATAEGHAVVTSDALAELQRHAEVAWAAVARLVDTLRSLR